jgi:GT2 family glycosyltransferase
MEVSIIIVNFNTTALIHQCIASIKKHCTNTLYEIIVVDNASSDRSIEGLTELWPEITLILNKDNKGFGSANNQGMEIAQGDFYFLLNSDTFLEQDCLRPFLNFMNDPINQQYGVCGAELSTGSSRPTVSYGNFPSLTDAIASLGFYLLFRSYYIKHINLGVVNYDDQVKDVDFISGAAMFIRKSVIQNAGGFDEDFFLYFEETELTYRIRKAGYKSIILPYVKIIHLEGQSQITPQFNYNRYKNFARSRNLYYLKTHGWFYALACKTLHMVHAAIFTTIGKEPGNLFRKLEILIKS